MKHGMVGSEVESAALDWLAELGYAALPSPQIAPGEPHAELASFTEVIRVTR